MNAHQHPPTLSYPYPPGVSLGPAGASALTILSVANPDPFSSPVIHLRFSGVSYLAGPVDGSRALSFNHYLISQRCVACLLILFWSVILATISLTDGNLGELDGQISPPLAVNLGSNNPFRNRALSPAGSATSGSRPPRPTSTNPFLDDTDSLSSPRSAPVGTLFSPVEQQDMTSNTRELFVRLSYSLGGFSGPI